MAKLQVLGTFCLLALQMAEGEMLYDKVKSAFLVLEEAEKSFLEFQELKVGEVRIGISNTLYKLMLISINYLLQNF